jgi:DnaK suppressor protein
MIARKQQTVHADTDTLQKQRAETLAELERLQLALETSEVDPSVDEADPDVVEREKILALMEALELRLEEIDAALEVAATGGYGICERCGQPIDPERLQIMPEATLCVQCKVLVERERAMHRASGGPLVGEL